jgi:hypothetical protein
VGERLSPGSRLFDVSVDLSAAVAHDCPPVSYFRICLSESAWLRQWSVATGDEVAAGSVLALFSSSPDEPSPPVVTNTARLSVAGIVCEIGWWEGGGT